MNTFRAQIAVATTAGFVAGVIVCSAFSARAQPTLAACLPAAFAAGFGSAAIEPCDLPEFTAKFKRDVQACANGRTAEFTVAEMNRGFSLFMDLARKTDAPRACAISRDLLGPVLSR